MAELELKNGNRVIMELHTDAQGNEILVDYIVDPSGQPVSRLKRCTCTCSNGTSASGTCEDPGQATCNCSGSSAEMSGCS